MNKIYVFCPTFTKDEKWSVFDQHVKNGKMEVYTSVTKQRLLKVWKEGERNKQKNKNWQSLIVFDDCGGQDEFKQDKPSATMNQLATRCNHDNISIVWSVQMVVHLSTTMRINSEGLIVFYVQSEAEKKYLYEQFGVGNFRYFKRILHHCTNEKYDYMFVNRQGPGMADYYHNFRYVLLEDVDV